MYNQYLDGGSFVLLDPEPQPHGQARRNPSGRSPEQGSMSGGAHRSPEPIRSEDLFLYLEDGDNLELVITLALLLLLGLDDGEAQE